MKLASKDLVVDTLSVRANGSVTVHFDTELADSLEDRPTEEDTFRFGTKSYIDFLASCAGASLSIQLTNETVIEGSLMFIEPVVVPAPTESLPTATRKSHKLTVVQDEANIVQCCLDDISSLDLKDEYLQHELQTCLLRALQLRKPAKRATGRTGIVIATDADTGVKSGSVSASYIDVVRIECNLHFAEFSAG